MARIAWGNTIELPVITDSVTSNEDEVDQRYRVFDGGTFLEGGNGVHLPSGARGEWRAPDTLNSDAGTLSAWVKPLWPPGDSRSHPVLAFRWSGSDDSYFVLSQGWWEPNGVGKLSVVLSNQQHVFCQMPRPFSYTYFLEGRWTQLTVTWQAGQHGYVRLFADGKIVCGQWMDFSGGRRPISPVSLGSDRVTGIAPNDRLSDFEIKNLQIVPRALGVDEVRAAYLRAGGQMRSKWLLALAPEGAAQLAPPHERRVMQDEDTNWASSKLEIQRRVERVKAAGFNVYMPNVWNGALAFYSTTNGHAAANVLDPANTEYDPLKYLIEQAHRVGLAVHPWVIVTRNPGGSVFPEGFTAGAPPDSFNVQNAKFRDFIVAVALDLAKRYSIDGLNLDYIRAGGACSDAPCMNGYARKYHRSIQDDWNAQERGETVPSLIEWNRAAVTDIVRRISIDVRGLAPHAVLSIDTVPFDHSRLHQGVDEETWLRRGWIDALIDMAYDDPLDVAGLDRAYRAFSPNRLVINVRDDDFVGETTVNRSGQTMQDYIRLIRTRWPGAGIGFYQYLHFSPDQGEVLRNGSFHDSAVAEWSR